MTIAYRLRIKALEMTASSGGSHIGSMFSIAEIIEALYFNVLKIEPDQPNSIDRDYFFLSKGHAGAIVLAALARRGFFGESELESYYQNGSLLSGHISHKVEGVELSTGSLGHALGVAVGVGVALKLQKRENRVFCLLSDGELDEGSNWEAMLLASHKGLNKLTIIIDYNKIQSLSSTAETLQLEPLADKFRAFGFKVIEVDGHDVAMIVGALNAPVSDNCPQVVIAHTIKGKGVSFMENSVLWHYRCARDSEYDLALSELESRL